MRGDMTNITEHLSNKDILDYLNYESIETKGSELEALRADLSKHTTLTALDILNLKYLNPRDKIEIVCNKSMVTPHVLNEFACACLEHLNHAEIDCQIIETYINVKRMYNMGLNIENTLINLKESAAQESKDIKLSLNMTNKYFGAEIWSISSDLIIKVYNILEMLMCTDPLKCALNVSYETSELLADKFEKKNYNNRDNIININNLSQIYELRHLIDSE